MLRYSVDLTVPWLQWQSVNCHISMVCTLSDFVLNNNWFFKCESTPAFFSLVVFSIWVKVSNLIWRIIYSHLVNRKVRFFVVLTSYFCKWVSISLDTRHPLDRGASSIQSGVSSLRAGRAYSWCHLPSKSIFLHTTGVKLLFWLNSFVSQVCISWHPTPSW